MPAKVRITTVIVLFTLTFVLLQGCGSSSNDVDAPGAGQSLNLDLTSSGGANTLLADGISALQLQMTVTTSDGKAVVNTPVAFSTNLGSFSAVPGTNVISGPVSKAAATTRQTNASSTITVGTDSTGIAFVQLVAGTATGTATITAEVEGFRQTFTVNLISGIPAQVALAAQPRSVGVGQTASIVATVTDSNGQPVSGITVTFSLNTSSGSSLSSLNAVTGADGTAKVTYVAGTTTGTDTIEALLVASTSATGNSISTTTNVTVQAAGSPSASSLELLVSSPQLDSDGSETVTLTALARDEINNFISGIEVSFEASSGGIQVINNTTDAAGVATALLTTAGDPANRTIKVTARAGEMASENFVEVSGTRLTISGTAALALGGTTTLSLLLQDSGGNGIPNEYVTVESLQGNGLICSQNDCIPPPPLPPISVKTDANGQASIQVKADNDGKDNITASALERVLPQGNGTPEPTVEGIFTLTVNSANFIFIAPTPENLEVDLGTLATVKILWQEEDPNTGNMIPMNGETINFFATRGTLSAPSAVTGADGTASVQISSSSAGPAVITAEAAELDGPSSQIAIEFVATDPTALVLEAKPTSLGVNPPGSNDQKSLITAIVRDADNNLVKNQQVSFTLTDTTGGSIFPASATTDSFGRASTVYTAGATVSAQDGVIIDAEVIGTAGCNPTDPIPSGPCDRVTLTVAQQSLFVALGTSHLIGTPTDTQYAKPYSVLVTDANSNPVVGATVELNIYPTRYQKGFYELYADENGNCLGWRKFRTVNPSNGFDFEDDDDSACENEDHNRNGILNAGEDINNNGVLDPGNTATVPTTVTTDESGFALFNVMYAREFTWVEVELEARVTVAGSEGSSTARFFLPGVASDFDDCDVAPPGDVSKFGTAISCSCDERVDPACPTLP